MKKRCFNLKYLIYDKKLDKFSYNELAKEELCKRNVFKDWVVLECFKI